MKLIFICAPYSRLDENYYKSINYCKYVVQKGFIPINPITMYHGVLDERVPAEYTILANANKALISQCDEVWVFGNAPESLIADATGLGKPVKYIEGEFEKRNHYESLNLIVSEYEKRMSERANGQIRQDIRYFLDNGLPAELIIEVIKKTARLKKQWNYSVGTLRNRLREGKTTVEEFLNNKPQKNGSMASYDLDLFEKMLNGKD